MTKYCVAGYNWGNITITEDEVSLSNDGYVILKTNPKTFIKSSLSNKTDVSVEFDEGKTGDVLCEIKFFSPSNGIQNEKDNATELFQKIEEVTPEDAYGKEVCVFENVAFVTPKGHYAVKMYEDYFRVQNITYDFKIKYSDIKTYYKLAKDEETSLLLLVLSKAVIRGKSEYESLLMELSTTEEVTVDLNLSKEFEKKTRLQEQMSGVAMELFSEIFGILRNVPIHKSGITFADNRLGPSSHYFQCNYGTNEGTMYPIKDCLIYVYKRVRLIKHNDIRQIDVLRMNNIKENKTFDLEITLRDKNAKVMFTGISRDLHGRIIEYLKTSKIEVNDHIVEKQENIDNGDDDSGDDAEVYNPDDEESYDEEEDMSDDDDEEME